MEPCGSFLYSRGPERATRTGLIMLIYSNGIVIMWQRLAVLSVASDGPIIMGTWHILHWHFQSLASESLKRLRATVLSVWGQTVFYGNAGLFLSSYTACVLLFRYWLRAMSPMANAWRHMYMLRRASLLLWLSLSKQTWAANQKERRRGRFLFKV